MTRWVVGGLVVGLLAAGTPHAALASPLPSPGTPRSLPQQLALGARGDQVAALQSALMSRGITVQGGADGVFGPATQNAVRTFQQRQGLPVTGVADAATLAALGLAVPSSNTGGSPGADTSQGATRGPAGTPVTPTGVLQVGSRGADVAALQRALISAGIAVPGGADGIFGPATQNAVTSFQRAQNLPVSGVADTNTLGALGLTGIAPAPGTAISGPLQVGARGEDVARLQRALLAAGIAVPGGADGVFGLATQAAVRTFQSQRGLPATGVADTATLAALGLTGDQTPTPTPTPTPPDVLRIGATGEAVREVQQALIRAGIHVQGGADGAFGPATQAAVRTFQSRNGLPATGEVDAATRAALGIGGQTPPPNTTVLLKVGDRGPDVVRVQQALLDRGIPVPGGADGVYGLATSGAVRAFQLNRGLTQTGNVDQATWDALGLNESTPTTPPPTIEVFPMQGPCYFGDTWGAARSGGRRHLGVDIIGATGRAIYAVTAGTITRKYLDTPGSLSGNGLRLTRPDGTYFFYAHLSEFAPGIEIGTTVVPGQVLGYNGATGNATVPHLHFEVHPGGGSPINPYPVVKAVDACNRSELLPQP